MPQQLYGLTYRETNPNGFLVDPWATISNFLFLAIGIYWTWKVWNRKDQKFLKCLLPILFLSFIGGTMYHATKNSPVWVFMDFVPIALIMIIISIYFWRKIGLNVWKIVLVTLMPFIIVALIGIFGFFTRGPSIGYFVMGLFVVFPILYYAIKINQNHRELIFYALISGLIALVFRSIDFLVPWQMGTHWLWHSFGAIATHFVFMYIYKTNGK